MYLCCTFALPVFEKMYPTFLQEETNSWVPVQASRDLTRATYTYAWFRRPVIFQIVGTLWLLSERSLETLFSNTLDNGMSRNEYTSISHTWYLQLRSVIHGICNYTCRKQLYQVPVGSNIWVVSKLNWYLNKKAIYMILYLYALRRCPLYQYIYISLSDLSIRDQTDL